jgi:hypothetical protein
MLDRQDVYMLIFAAVIVVGMLTLGVVGLIYKFYGWVTT